MLYNKKKFQIEMPSDDTMETKRRKHAPLPPIIHNQAYFKDTYENSFLMRFDLKKQNEKKLKKILYILKNNFFFYSLF